MQKSFSVGNMALDFCSFVLGGFFLSYEPFSDRPIQTTVEIKIEFHGIHGEIRTTLNSIGFIRSNTEC